MKKTLYSLLLPCLLTVIGLLAASGRVYACDITVSSTTIKGSCDGLPNGSVTVTHDGTAPFTYAWSHNTSLNAATATGLANGTVTVTITDAAGCSATANIVIPLISGPQAFLTPVADTCQLGRGKAVATIAGGLAPFTIGWDDPLKQANDTAFNLGPGTYTFIVGDAQGCADTATVTLTSKDDALSASIAVVNAKCFGLPGGTVKAIAQGVVGAWTYTWKDTTATTDSLDNLLAGPYTVTIALGGCTASTTAAVGQPTQLQSALFIVQRPGCAVPTGIYRAVAAGGTGPYRFSWETTPVQFNDTVFNVMPGSIFYTVTDTNNCTLRQEYVIETANGPTLTFEQLREDYCGKREGVLRIRTTGGTQPFVFEWRNFGSILSGETTEFLYNRAFDDVVKVVITDADGCIRQAETTVKGTKKIRISSFSKTEEYCEQENGTATAFVDPGTGLAPYTYFWNSTPVQQGIDFTTADSLIHGNYRLIVADAHNCRDSVAFEILTTPGFSLSTQSVEATCSNSQDGTLDIIPLNAPNPISYVWADDASETSPSRSGLNPGSYLVTATDSRNCTRSIVGIVDGPPPLLPEFSSTPAAMPVDTIPLGVPIQFTEESEGEEFYLWNFGNDSLSAFPNPNYTYPAPGEYEVRLIILNNGGKCADTVYHSYLIIPRSFLVMPNAFTPNNDVGQINATFLPVYAEMDTIGIAIFNRYGKKVYEESTSGVLKGWDGQYDGMPAPEGAYVYVVFGVGNDKIRYDKHGKLLLIR